MGFSTTYCLKNSVFKIKFYTTLISKKTLISLVLFKDILDLLFLSPIADATELLHYENISVIFFRSLLKVNCL